MFFWSLGGGGGAGGGGGCIGRWEKSSQLVALYLTVQGSGHAPLGKFWSCKLLMDDAKALEINTAGILEEGEARLPMRCR